jgi:hypothetical protein
VRTPEKCAHRLLQVFADFREPAGDCLRQSVFETVFYEDGWQADHFEMGLNLCLGKGWVTLGPDTSICVTQAGLDEIGA